MITNEVLPEESLLQAAAELATALNNSLTPTMNASTNFPIVLKERCSISSEV